MRRILRLILKEVPSYREQAIRRAITDYGNDYKYWDKAWSKRHHYVVDQFGFVYEKSVEYGFAFYEPHEMNINEYLVGQKPAKDVPLICECGSLVFTQLRQNYDDLSCECFYCRKKI